jgi:hypothetical protein
MQAASAFWERTMSSAFTARQRPSLSATRLATGALGKCRSLIDRLTDPYRPELHYMRGPGPKWRAKHAVDGRTEVVRG